MSEDQSGFSQIGHKKALDSAWGHVTGTSQFVDDRAPTLRELIVGVVGSPVAAGVLRSIDSSMALKIPGVLDIVTAKDLHHNRWGTIFRDQPLLIESEIGYYDEPICLVVAESKEALALGKKALQFHIESKPALLNLAESIQKKDFLYQTSDLVHGNVELGFQQSPHRIKGVLRSGAQEHFYLESQAAIAYPLENGQIEVHSSTQHPSETQRLVAEACGLMHSEVVCLVRRMGGGFGGKESQAGPFAAYAAIVAQRTKRPARIVLSKDDDMRITGKRHPFQTFYEVGFDEEGKIIALSVELFADGGAYCDLSSSILERAVFHADGCYFIPNVKITGAVCRTNTASNTAFRGFGGPQGNLVAENVIQEIAQFLRKDAFSIRELNLYSQKRGERTHYEQFIEHNFLPQIFSQIRKDSDYDQRCLEIETFNRKSPKKVRGIAVSGVKFGIAFTARFLNQASALVNWHLDGSVQVSTAATEMGQGVNTKIAQAVAEALGIDFQQVKVMATSTEKTHNTSPTAASSGSDLNCGAALKACDVLKLRLVGVAEKMLQNEPIDPHHDLEIDTLKQADLKKWRFADQKVTAVSSGESVAIKDVLAMAYQNRISLGAQAHFKTEGLGFDKKIWRGKAFNYFTMGAAVSEVEVDRDTGEVKILRVDILMDIGRSMNPGIDRGQVTGGFVQGMGWLTTEKIVHNQDGRVLTFSPTTYKIPNIQDTPRVFNVRFIENHTTQNVYGSKAVGEPPLLLGTSVWLAIKDALHRVNPANVVDIQAPATGEVVLLALEGLKQGGV